MVVVAGAKIAATLAVAMSLIAFRPTTIKADFVSAKGVVLTAALCNR